MVHTEKIRNNKEKHSLINRLKRIEGQIRGLEKMVENNAYCPDILIQVSAASSALNSFNKALLKKHIESCVINDIKNGKEEVVNELVNVMQKLMR